MVSIKEAGFMLSHVHFSTSGCHELYFLLHGSVWNYQREHACCISAVQPFVTDMIITLPCLLYMFRILVYPPPPCKGGIPINTEDYACLGEDQFLNDVIIDFYLK